MGAQAGTEGAPLAREELETYLVAQESLDLLRFITCGSVDDGKSTLIGRLLYEGQQIFEDQLETLAHDSRRQGTQGAAVDLALLVDGLAAEREQGITIDVAYRFFATDKRRFIVADTPGHEQYTRNMVTGASTADAALLLIDARAGVLTQTRRHAFICSLLGIRHVVLAINKMDLVEFSEARFRAIASDFAAFAQDLSFESVTPIPLSALEGDNVLQRSRRSAWYDGPTLMAWLETVEPRGARDGHDFRFPVQWVNRPSLDFRGYAGTVAAGRVAVGDEIRVLPSGHTAKVESILLYREQLAAAAAGQAVTITLDRELDCSRGDVLVAAKAPCEVADQFDVDLVWMDEEPGFVGRSYLMRLGTLTAGAQITEVKERVDMDTLETRPARRLELNDISTVKIACDRPVPFEPYRDCAPMGAFVLVDRYTNATVGAGMIRYALRRSRNVHTQALTVDRAARERLNGHPARVIWFTGLSGSGKSTIANALEQALHERGVRTYILDGDNVRHGLNKDLGFSDADRVENIRRIAEVARLMVDAGVVVLTAFISPFRAERELARSLFGAGEFVEVFVDTPLDVVEKRDPKGLYGKARRGEIPNFTGIDSPYEAPESPEFRVDTTDASVEEIVEQLLATFP
ncbi:MAG: sulfate adenylyltransferase subunit CysN [Pseudomonadales bacterium]|jgi:bifunctional enzyme CysN/CysC|nr:sulfate adenylyltransferase subunit CysN [Pseudomonadales bacterium]